MYCFLVIYSNLKRVIYIIYIAYHFSIKTNRILYKLSKRAKMNTVETVVNASTITEQNPCVPIIRTAAVVHGPKCHIPCYIPKILQDMQDYLENYKVKIADAVEGEGRGGSLKDERSIKDALCENPVFKEHIVDEQARKFGDILVLDYDKINFHPVNIKTSIGSSDNAFSKGGIVYAFTDLAYDKIPKAMNFHTMNTLVHKNKAEIHGRDYWFLCIDKIDSSRVLIRGLKQINHLIMNVNPSNILQINWKKEKTVKPKYRTYDEAYDTIFGIIKKSINSFIQSLPSDWIDFTPNVPVEEKNVIVEPIEEPIEEPSTETIVEPILENIIEKVLEKSV
jgi:hypothetical protein